MRGIVCTLGIAFASCYGCQGPTSEMEIRDILDQQVVSWNEGDIEGFMRHYWNSDDLEFEVITKQKLPDSESLHDVRRTTKGWNATLERYRKRYPSRRKMGRLSFSIQEVRSTTEGMMQVTGHYILTNDEGPSSGRFILTWKRIDDRWVIIRDETYAD